MTEQKETERPVDAVQDTAARRLSERLGDPLLFAYVSFLVLREWKFWYFLIRSDEPVAPTIKEAATLISWYQVICDFGLAIAFVLAWPWIHLATRRYIAWMEVKTQNAMRRIREGRYITLEELSRHQDYQDVSSQLLWIEHFARVGPSKGVRPSGPIGFARTGKEQPHVPGFALLSKDPVGNNAALPTAVPLPSNLRSSDRDQIVYLIGPAADDLRCNVVVCAANGATVPWPPGFDGHDVVSAGIDGRLLQAVVTDDVTDRLRLARPDTGHGYATVHTGAKMIPSPRGAARIGSVK